ncbi:MAG: DMT family transporter [Clostridia bacterium]|nr:DMT family transporter [Clostridia bacterium]
MFPGIIAGITWAVETALLWGALSLSPLADFAFLAPLVATFLHDLCSAIFATAYNGVRGNIKNVWNAFKTKSGKWVAIAAIIGGPIGMTGYVMCINYMGIMGAVASAIFPAIGTVLAYFFLKERMKWYQWIFLVITLCGVFALGITDGMATENFLLGFIGALLCAFGWGIEAVILAKSMKDGEVTDEQALQIRQTTSALFNGIILIPIVSLCVGNHSLVEGWKITAELFNFSVSGLIIPVIVIAGFFATVSYLFYYKAINEIGAAKAMALNVTYAAWALVFNIPVYMWLFELTFKETLPTGMSVLYALIVLVCSIFAAADYKEIFKKNK